MIKGEFDGASDEAKLQGIKDEMDNFTTLVKIMITTCTTIEAHRQLITGEIPDEFKEFVDSKEYQSALVAAIAANNEVMRNILTFMARMGDILGADYSKVVPRTNEEFQEMNKQLDKEIEKWEEESYFKTKWDI